MKNLSFNVWLQVAAGKRFSLIPHPHFQPNRIITISHHNVLKASLSMFNFLLIVSILVASVKMESVIHCINDKNCCDANCEAYGRKLWQIFAIFIPAVLCANDCLNGFEKCRKMAEKGLKPEPCESTKDGKPCTLL